jgi:hypothetical protein
MYSITGLPPGNYTVSATVPAGFVTNQSTTVSLADKACAEVGWPIHYDGHIGGRVVDRNGSPISQLAMTLSYGDSDAPDGYGTTGLVMTDAEGRYDFEGLSPGILRSRQFVGPSPILQAAERAAVDLRTDQRMQALRGRAGVLFRSEAIVPSSLPI